MTMVKDAWKIVEFNPVSATTMQLRVKMNKDFAAGIHETVVE